MFVNGDGFCSLLRVDYFETLSNKQMPFPEWHQCIQEKFHRLVCEMNAIYFVIYWVGLLDVE